MDTLAEVSRRHLDLTRQRNMASRDGQSYNESEEGDHGLSAILAHIHGQNNTGNQTSEQARAALNALNQGQSLDSGIPQLVAYVSPPAANTQEPTDLQAVLRRRNEQNIREQENQVNAPASNGLSHQARRIMTIGNNPVDPQLQSNDFSSLAKELERANRELDRSQTGTPSSQMSHVSHQAPVAPAPAAAPQTQNAPVPVPHVSAHATVPTLPAVPVARYGTLAKSGKKAKRNRFSDNRRKEVHGIRKLGACIRCRMLKKPVRAPQSL